VTFFSGSLADDLEARFQPVNDVSELLVIEKGPHAFAPTRETYLTDSFEIKELIRISSSVSLGATVVHDGHKKHLTNINSIGNVSHRYGNTSVNPVLNDMHKPSRHNQLALWG